MSTPSIDPAGYQFGDWDRLRESFLRAAATSPFVEEQLERSGMSATEAVADPNAFSRLAPVGKAELLADQQAQPPFGRRCSVPTEEISLIVESSGSTGQGREVHCATQADLERNSVQWAAYLAGMGVTPSDVVALTFPIGMAGGGVKHWYAYVSLGARVLRVGGLSSEAKLDAIRRYQASVLVATPAYIDRLAVITAEAGVPAGELGIERIVVATQSLSPEWIQSTEELWGAKMYEWYGTSAGIAAFSCARGMLGADGHRGTLHWHPAAAVQEVVAADGSPVEDGQRGEMIGTPLLNGAEPMFRVRTGDEVRFIAPGSCSCGSDWPGIESGTVRRLDEMIKVKGINVWPAQVEASLLELPDVLDYRVRIWQDDEKRERAELRVLAQGGAAPELGERLATELRSSTEISFDVVLERDRGGWTQHTAGEAGKAKRWVDERAGVVVGGDAK